MRLDRICTEARVESERRVTWSDERTRVIGDGKKREEGVYIFMLWEWQAKSAFYPSKKSCLLSPYHCNTGDGEQKERKKGDNTGRKGIQSL